MFAGVAELWVESLFSLPSLAAFGIVYDVEVVDFWVLLFFGDLGFVGF